MRVQNVTYKVPSNKKKGEKAVILNDVTGFFNPGCMTAVVSHSPNTLHCWDAIPAV